MPLTLILNGQKRSFEELAANATLTDLIGALGLKADRIALELNGAIIARKAWAEAGLNDGDRLELVHFVGGG